MFSLLRFFIKLALIAFILAFAAAIGMAWLFAHPEVTTTLIFSPLHQPKYVKMNRVLTMPASQSAPYVHEFKVYSIQSNRQLLEQLGNGGADYFALREAGGHMRVLYQLQFGQGLLLNPNKSIGPQLAQLRVNLTGTAQVRLVKYMEATKKGLGSDYAKLQLFYLLEEFGRLHHKPKPPRNGQSPMYFDYNDLIG